ncbi:hypothetical protein [Streptomyces sp. NPDC102360]|uniref:hypothetical protein n=1 Tax=Streptomyces sp. NPDC102360 TaxID=3366160 RepID=UPI0037F2B05E
MGHLCGAETKKRTSCRRRVRQDKVWCHFHVGGGRFTGRPRRRAPADAGRRAGGVDAGAALWADILDKGAVDAIAARAAEYTSEAAWRALVSEQRRSRGCDELAVAARELLKSSTHAYLRDGVADAVRRSGGTEPMAAFVGELVRRVTLPFDSQLVLAARALQICGIVTCGLQGIAPADCACLHDMTVALTAAEVEPLIAAAMEDWQRLPERLGPR